VLRILDFAFVHPKEVASFSQVCSHLSVISSSEDLWRRVCLNHFGYVHPLTVSRSGSWKSLMRNKSLIENSPWEVKPREATQVLQNGLLGVTSMAVNDDHIALGGGSFEEPFEVCSLFVERTVNIYNRRTFELEQNIHTHLASVSSVQFYKNYMMACGAGGKARLWKYDYEGGYYEYRRTFKAHQRTITCLNFDRRTVVTASRDGVLKTFDFRSSVPLRTIEAHSKSINGMDWDGRRIITAGQDKALRLWHLETGTCTQEFFNKNWFLCTRLKDQLVLTGGEGKVKLWDLRSGEEVRSFSCNTSFPPSWVTCLQFDDNKVVAGSFNRCTYVWDFGSSKTLNRWAAHEDKITALFYEGTELFTASRDRTVRQWNFDSEPILPTYPPEKSTSSCKVM
jgi:WD40 repeat protein